MLQLPAVEEEAGLNAYPVFYWNHAALEMNRITHSLGGPQGGPTMSSRALGLLHLAMHDAFFIALGPQPAPAPSPYLADKEVEAVIAAASLQYSAHELKGGQQAGDLDNANLALTGAAVTMLDMLYAREHPSISIVASDTLTGALKRLIDAYDKPIDVLHPTHGLGVIVARRIFDLLGVKPGEPGADAGRYEPKQGRYKFRDEPVTPVRPSPIDPNDPSRGANASHVYHGPFYGISVPHFAVHDPDGHRLEKWPEPAMPGDPGEYQNALEEVVALGGAAGAPKTTRSPDQTVAAYYWAYDGANLIGTPPRLYNQIARQIVWSKKRAAGDELARTSEFVRVLALVNVAMADAGKYAWREKYRYELWRPLSGVREHDVTSDHDAPRNQHLSVACADPFWTALGAPETNSDRVAFKPPFPAYPSGHATFGAAAFQIMRLHYWTRDGQNLPADLQDPKDGLAFSFISEELNGISRDLRQPYDGSKPIQDQQGVVRTRLRRSFAHLWDAIFENALSRIYLGVHWRFDAADIADMSKPDKSYKAPADIAYSHVWTAKRAAGDKLPTGGIPLGLGIAIDIFQHGMKQPQQLVESTARPPLEALTSLSSERAAKLSNTTYR